MSDSSAVDIAVVGYLNADATLLTVAPGRAWMDEVPQAAVDPHVLVAVESDPDVQHFRGTAYEVHWYAIEALDRSSTTAGVRAAYARIHALMQDAAFAITGYTLLKCVRRQRYRSAIDDGDQVVRQLGGIYEVWAQPTA